MDPMNTRGDVNSYSGLPTDPDSASSGVAGASRNAASDTSGLEGDTVGGVDNSGLEGPQVQRALDPNAQENALGNGPMAKDPVCGVMVDISTARNTLPAPVGSRMDTLYFDSPECKALFEANPDQYIANY